MMVTEMGCICAGPLQNPCPNVFVFNVFEVLDAVATPMLEELAALHPETINQVRTAAKSSRFALGQVDPAAALGGTAANLPHFLPSQDLGEPELLYDKCNFCLSPQAAALPRLVLFFDRASQASLTHPFAAARSTQTQVSRIWPQISAKRRCAFRRTPPRHCSRDGIPARTTMAQARWNERERIVRTWMCCHDETR